MSQHLVIPPGQRLHASRPHFLNASEVGAAAGVDAYQTRLGLWAAKTGQLPSQADNPMMRRGRWFECAVIAALRELHPDWDIRYPLNRYFYDETTRQGCTPDAVGITDMPGLTNIQIKVVAKPEFEKSWMNGPPEAYLLQCLQEAALMEVDQSLLVAMVVSSYRAELHEYRVPRHAAAEQRLRDIAAAFWDRIATGERPPADVERDAETVAAMFPVSQPEPVLDLSGDNRLAELLPVRAMLKREIGTLEKDVAKIDTEIKDKLGPAELAVLPGWKLSWKTQHIAEHVAPASTRRPLLVTAIEDEEAAAA